MVELLDVIVWGTFLSMQMIILFVVIWMLRKRQVWSLIRLGLAGHGTLVQKFLPDNSVEFAYSNKPVTKVFWRFKDNHGKIRKFFQPIEGVKHTLAGSAIPLHLCIHDSQTNISLLAEKEKELTAKETNEMVEFGYMQGVIDTRKMMMPKAGFDFNWKILLIVGIFVVVAIVMWPSLSSQMATMGV